MSHVSTETEPWPRASPCPSARHKVAYPVKVPSSRMCFGSASRKGEGGGGGRYKGECYIQGTERGGSSALRHDKDIRRQQQAGIGVIGWVIMRVRY